MPPKPIVPKTPVTKPPVLFTIPHYFTDTIIRLRGMIKLIGR